MNFNPREDQHGGYPAVTTQVNIQVLLRELFQKYRAVLTHPSVATFDAELPAASWQAVWIGAAIMAIAWAIGSFIVGLEQSTVYSSGPSLGSALGIFVVFVIAFFFASAVYHLIAKMFGGTASFLTYTYAVSLVVVPLDTVAGLALIIPVLGILAVFAAGLYGLYLLVLATPAAQRLTVGKAVAVVLIPAGASMILSCAFSSLLILLLVMLAGVGR